jgi:hypothetical protein
MKALILCGLLLASGIATAQMNKQEFHYLLNSDSNTLVLIDSTNAAVESITFNFQDETIVSSVRGSFKLNRYGLLSRQDTLAVYKNRKLIDNENKMYKLKVSFWKKEIVFKSKNSTPARFSIESGKFVSRMEEMNESVYLLGLYKLGYQVYMDKRGEDQFPVLIGILAAFL